MTSGTFAQHVRTVAVSSLRAFIPYPIRLQLRRLLTKDDYFLPDMQATPDVLEQRFALFRDALLATPTILVPSQFVKDMLVRNGYPGEAIVVLPLGMQRPATTSPCRNDPIAGAPGLRRLAAAHGRELRF